MSVLPKVPPEITGPARDYLIELVRQMERELGRRHPVQQDGKQYIGFERPYVYVDEDGEQHDLLHGGDLTSNGGVVAETDKANTFSSVQEFVNMPTVGGDPIVESGSNSDGEWTRWADGTQAIRSSVSIDGTLLEQSFPHPAAFVGGFPAGSISFGNMNAASRDSISGSYARSAGGGVGLSNFGIVIPSANTGAEIDIPAYVIFYGRWK